MATAANKTSSVRVKVPGLYTCEQAADKLSMKTDTVRRYVHRGVIRAGVLGGIYLISDAELRRFTKERRGRGNPQFRSRKTG